MIYKISIFIILFQLSFPAAAQFIRGISLYAGGSLSKYKYVNSNPVDNITLAHTIPAPTHNSGEYLSWSAGVFAEFIKHEHIRWQTEFAYFNKGAVEKIVVASIPEVIKEKKINKYGNIQWNNFLKVMFNELYVGTPYFMLGMRSEYTINKTVSIYPGIADKLPQLNFTPDIGAGFEFVAFSNMKLYTEIHYNRDVMKFQIDGVSMRNRSFELRVGLIYRFKKAIEDCNAPRYHGPSF